MKKITIEILISAGACFDQVRKFQRAYPKGCAVCWMCFQEAKRKGLPVGWLKYVLYPGIRGYHQRCAFTQTYVRSSQEGASVLLEGLKFLERELLKCSPPKPTKGRIADYRRWTVERP